jgi:predicted neuraminidase
LAIELWEGVAPPSERFPSCHCSVITELDNGDLLVGYYAGTGEARPDAAWVIARRVSGRDQFDPLETVADSESKPEGNGILFQDREGKVVLVYNTMHGRLDGRHGPGVRWQTCDLRMKTSDDRGKTWSNVMMVDAKWGHVPRCKPIRLKSGHLIFGTEYDDGHSRFWISEDDGQSWFMTGPIMGEPNQHPTLIERNDGSLLALLRPSGSQGCVLQSESFDGGHTWSDATTTDLASPFAALDAVKLDDGRVVVAWNSNPKARNPLTLALSEDDGRTWSHRRDLVTGEGSFHYPAIIQTRDGLLHITFTNNRETIDHVVLHVDWILGDGGSLPAWDGTGKRLRASV